MKRFYLSLILTFFTFPSLNFALERVDLTISAENKAILESDPYSSTKVPATWVAGGVTYEVSVSYRGAYGLQNLIREGYPQRNWKIKTTKEFPYQEYREWNYNFQQHIREKLAYDLYQSANVPAVPARHVELFINGTLSGVFLEFPDPDNKPWLKKTWGSAAGNLYKAATDLPGSTAYFGETTDLGPTDSSLYLHYQKKTNNDSIDSLDYSSLRLFLNWVKISSDEEFSNKLSSIFNVNSFIRYLVVSNFIGHWDGFPNRGKNYWMYEDPVSGLWNMIPWDVDATFQNPTYCLNNMGSSAGLFFMNWPTRYCASKGETKERPLFERIMAIEKWHKLYVGEYQKALNSYLKEELLQKRVDSLSALVAPHISIGIDSIDYADDVAGVKQFITVRTTTVKTLLEAFPVYEGTGIRETKQKNPLVAIPKNWYDIEGKGYSAQQIQSAPNGVYWRGSERKIILR